MKITNFFLLLFPILFTGCGFSSQTIQVIPAPEISVSNVGENRKAWAKVIDDRESKIVGFRSSKGNDGQIRLADIFESKILAVVKDALRKKGFQITEPHLENVPHITVELRGLRYEWRTQLLSKTVHLECAIRIKGNNSSRTFDRVYRSELDPDVFWHYKDDNEKFINEVLSSTMAKFLNDDELLVFLAGESKARKK